MPFYCATAAPICITGQVLISGEGLQSLQEVEELINRELPVLGAGQFILELTSGEQAIKQVLTRK